MRVEKTIRRGGEEVAGSTSLRTNGKEEERDSTRMEYVSKSKMFSDENSA